MTHRSPLVTLVGLVAAFAIMFGVNVASSAPRGSYVNAGPPSAAPSTPAPSAPASSAPTTSSPPTSAPPKTIEPSVAPTTKESPDSAFPGKVVYAGRTKDGTTAVAVAVLGTKAAAYLCDGRNVEAWLRGTVAGDELTLENKKGTSTLEAKLDGSKLTGKVEIGDEDYAFAIGEAKSPAGLYRAKGSKTTIGWIVLPDGSQVGIATTGEESSAAPKLDPANPEVTVDDESLTGEPVTGDEDV